jgi:hypothetical protein
MAGRKVNAAEGIQLTITVSRQSFEALTILATRGLHGRSVPEVAARFVDKALLELVELPAIKLTFENLEK